MTMLKTNENGRSMIEMLGVLAIIGVLSVGGIAGYSKAMNKYKTNKVADNVSMIVTNIRTLYAQQNNFKGLTNETAVDMGVVPDELVASSGGLQNAFLGPVYIHAADAAGLDANGADNGGDDKAFVVIFGGLSKEACVTLATNDWGSGYSSGLLGIRVKGAATSGLDGNATDNTTNDDGRIDSPCKNTAKTDDGYACPGSTTAPSPLKVSAAADACSCASGTNTCEILWKYY